MEDTRAYVSKLDQFFRSLWKTIDLYVRDAADTGSDEFQIAAGILDVFEDRVRQWKQNGGGS